MQKGEQVTRLLPWLNNMLFLKSCQIDREVEMLWKFYSYYCADSGWNSNIGSRYKGFEKRKR